MGKTGRRSNSLVSIPAVAEGDAVMCQRTMEGLVETSADLSCISCEQMHIFYLTHNGIVLGWGVRDKIVKSLFMSEKSPLNGSVELLADAMRKVFSEAVEGAVKPLTTEVSAFRTEVNDKFAEVNNKFAEVNNKIAEVNNNIDTTNANMQVQFAEQEKKIGKLISGSLPAK